MSVGETLVCITALNLESNNTYSIRSVDVTPGEENI
jgi:hypothetical protein